MIGRAFRARWTRPITGLIAVVVAAGSIFSAISADAGPSHAPSAFARHAVLRIFRGRKLRALGSPRPALVAGDLVGLAGGGRVQLGGGNEVIGALTGSLTPVAVPSHDDSIVAYSSWHQIARIKPDEPGEGLHVGDPIGIPSVRLYDARTAKDTLVATGAYAPAVAPSGELAFVRGNDNVVRQNVDYVGQVVVGAPSRNSYVQWTSTAARYFTYAWARSSLLVYRAVPESEETDLYAFTGPGDARLLAPDATVVALSPDGARALITVGRRTLEVIRLADAAVDSSLQLDGPGIAPAGSSSTPHALMYSGSWLGDRVVANSDAGLVVLNVKGGLRIESVFAVPLPHGIIEPTFIDDTHIVGWADLTPVSAGKRSEPAYDHALIRCDLAASSCVTGPSQPARAWTRWVTNPSR